MDKFPSRERAAQASLELRVSAIVVVARARPGAQAQSALDLCLRSALAEPWVDDLVVVDLDNPPQIASALRTLHLDRRDVKVVSAPAGASTAAAANLGVEQARARWLLFLSPDVVLQRGAVARLAAAGGGASSPWIVGGRLLDAEGRERRAARTGVLTPWSAFAVALGWSGAKPRVRRHKDDKQEAPLPTPVSAVSDALMLISRNDFEALGGFDEEFATDAADLDLCRRAAAAGGSVIFQPDASGVQFVRGAQRGRKQAQGLALFAEKSARSPIEKAFAVTAAPVISVLLALKDFVAGRPPG